MEITKSKVLIVGGTGYIGRRIVKASLEQGHETYVLQRRELGLYDIEKVQMLLSFKRLGARLVEASFSDHWSLVQAMRLVDVVVCAMSGVPFRSHNILLQLKLVDAIKEAGNVKRFLPSEFGMDAGRMGHALAPGRITFDDKVTVRRAIEEAHIPYTYVSANCFAGYFIGGLCDFKSLTPPRGKVHLYGDGKVKAIFVDEDDVGTYTIKAIDDPRTLNKTLYLRPSDNILSQRQVVEMYESLSGKRVETVHIPETDFLASMEGETQNKSLDHIGQIGVGHHYHIFYEGSLTNFEIGAGGEEASELYPEVHYTRMDEYMKQYL